jgi:4-hydroxythreonine-4-phosphate dehydrogenase
VNQPPRIAVTTGEPAGIGPDLCILAKLQQLPAELVLIGDSEVFVQRATALKSSVTFSAYNATRSPHTGSVVIENVTTQNPVQAGQLDPGNADYVLQTLNRAIEGCLSGEFDAMVTCPVQKSIINQAGIAFTGHTEYLQEHTKSGHVVMLLAAPTLRVALATTHLPLNKVADALSTQGLVNTLHCLHLGLVTQMGITDPLILVTGLNPHAGEDGHLGSEEIDIIQPAIEQVRSEGMRVEGPLPADTLFTPPFMDRADAVLAMYHDQGLPVLKHLGFGYAVNITLGLPIIRTSVDHGTALDLAGSGKAKTGSLSAAINSALDMIAIQQKS